MPEELRYPIDVPIPLVLRDREKVTEIVREVGLVYRRFLGELDHPLLDRLVELCPRRLGERTVVVESNDPNRRENLDQKRPGDILSLNLRSRSRCLHKFS
jgi:hypothetical protein